MAEKTNACIGACCAAFSLPYSHTKLKEMARRDTEPRWAQYPDDEMFLTEHEKWRDLQKVADMVIPLGKRVGNPVVEQSNDNHKLNFFTCMFFDGETRRCLDYENRPKMCSDFPYRMTTCPYEGCGHYNGKLARRGKRALKLFDEHPKEVAGG